ncbi:MAG: hypothetical protein GY765_30425 [bacterium]|nr:hypothetical protein [bacterium]
MEQIVGKADSLKLVGGRSCLDFVNTADWHGSETIVEHLDSYRDLVLWAGHALALSASDVGALIHEAEKRPAEAAKVYKAAIIWREALLRIFYAIQRQEKPAQKDLDIFNKLLSKTMKHLRLSLAPAGPCWGWTEAGEALERVLWPVVKDAAELLTSEQLPRVSRCADETCGWLFIDTSRNRSRRWCDMKDCGNRAKVRRHYRKKQE